MLINERANCNLQNVSGQTPLDLACENGNNEVSIVNGITLYLQNVVL